MRKILVIEDEDNIREDIVEILTDIGFNTISTEDGFTGVQMAQYHKPDLIICDIMMSGLDGYGVLGILRQDPSTTLIPFIFLSAKADRFDIRHGMNLGADDYLTKPVGQAELIEAIVMRFKRQEKLESYYGSLIQQNQEQIDYLTYYDSLTNLPNRLFLWKQLEEVLNQSNDASQFISILLINLDRFGHFNDLLGQKVSDQLLQSVAERLNDSIDQNDLLARMNADEFVIILSSNDPKGEADNVARTILEVIREPFQLEQQEVFLTCSIGVTVYPKDGEEIDTLIQHVRAAMSQAKQQGGNVYQFYSNNLYTEVSEELTLETSLHHALERDELQVFFQPQVNSQTGEVISVESLVRWYHPELGLLSPQKFIPLAEENGAIVSIDEWVLRTTCIQAKICQSILDSSPKSRVSKQFKIAVNLSGRQFQQHNFSTNILNILEELDFDPTCLEIELAESIIVRDVEASITKLNDLKAIGIQIALDDFGTGRSSLGYLKQFPIDTLKIDQCFIRHMIDEPTSRAIVLSIIQLAHSLNLRVIAEGVETKAELDFLTKNGCHEIQGYIFSRPIPAEELKRLLLRY